MPKHLVVVESPAKAQTIKKYLGPDYEVMASYGHVRDLPSKPGAVEPDRDFEMHYAVIEDKEKRIAALARAMKKSDSLILATDPDREGEAISWHVAHELRERDVLDGKPLQRVVFYEITKRAVREAVAQPREIAMDLVNAQQARRALDHLVGFNISPLLWRMFFRPGLSAGRVQSPALRMIVEREQEIERFQSREYWSIEADLQKRAGGIEFVARLVHDGERKLEQFSITDAAGANEAVIRLRERAADADAAHTPAQPVEGYARVVSIENKQRRRNPTAPFTTSTLQQEASRKLGFSARKTMQTAQRLYEGAADADGLITYMRTDSVALSGEAVADIREFIARTFGSTQLPDSPRIYKTKSKNAQEAHEAIRPTDVTRKPQDLRGRLDEDQRRLYDLIWKRTVACQMLHAVIDQVVVELKCGANATPDGGERLRATGSTVREPGFLAVYEEGRDDAKDDERSSPVPPLQEGEVVWLRAIRPEQHFTEPPPRYSEASLVRALEEYGIGRPSTYASIISTLQGRNYVRMDRRRFRPTDIGRFVNLFLTDGFERYVDYEFTARLEDDLDAVSRGEIDWKELMRRFWDRFLTNIEEVKGDHEKYRPVLWRELGRDPQGGRVVWSGLSKVGPCIRLGSPDDNSDPRFESLPEDKSLFTVTLDEALELLSRPKMPRCVGHAPDGGELWVGIGRFGPYVRKGDLFASVPKDVSPYDVTLELTLDLLEQKRISDAAKLIKDFADSPIIVKYGRWKKPTITDPKAKRYADVPKDRDPKSLTLEECEALLAERAARSTTKKVAKKVAKKKTATKKKSKRKAKKKAKKKTASKKTGSNKAAIKKSASKTVVGSG
ncbi:MAG: type I DNA topoisomerase, partial [Gammaproteobacteria bacterium]